MKRLKKMSIDRSALKSMAIVSALSVALVSCQKQNGSPNGVNNFLGNTNGLKITEFIEEGEDETNTFSGYVFLFDSNGNVTATKLGESTNGTYNVFSDDGQTELEMVFSNNIELEELTDDWYFVSNDENNIHFEDNGDILKMQKL
jgi:hypothetical protein